jgi:RNA binding exosome subunit
MTGTFHWVRVRLFCHSTENEGTLEEVMAALTGSDELSAEISEGHHGNLMLIFEAAINNEKGSVTLFSNLGRPVVQRILDDLDGRIDDDCVFHLRLDKQKAVLGEYDIAHHGDVISITAKIVSHPARKSIAVGRMREFLLRL